MEAICRRVSALETTAHTRAYTERADIMFTMKGSQSGAEFAKPKLDGGLWHPYRRAWAISRKHLPTVDVAAAGGWSGGLVRESGRSEEGKFFHRRGPL